MNLNILQGVIQQQKLALNPEIIQSLKILQMPINELQEDIQRELEENPFLEVSQEETGETLEKSDQNINDYDVLFNMKANKLFERFNSVNSENNQIDPLNLIIEKKTLKDYLFEQVRYSKETDVTKYICCYIIENIDERGYLDSSVEEIAADLKIPVSKVIFSLKVVQDFKPLGIAARDLKECLVIQLRKRKIKDKNIYILVNEYLELIANNKIKEISCKMDLETAKVQEYCNIIRSLEPKPSRGFYTGRQDNYIIPEAYIRKIGDGIHIFMNDSLLPRLSLNKFYIEIYKKHGDNTTLYIPKEKINSAALLIKGIEDRQKTIYRILEKIVELQKDYFLNGEQFIKPMVIEEIAEGLKIHESTVSRAIKDKYISTPLKVVKIKSLFTTALKTGNQQELISTNNVKNEIKKLIDTEDKAKPLSDQDICDILNQNTVNISRRTVAKYREELGIASSSKRRTY